MDWGRFCSDAFGASTIKCVFASLKQIVPTYSAWVEGHTGTHTHTHIDILDHVYTALYIYIFMYTHSTYILIHLVYLSINTCTGMRHARLTPPPPQTFHACCAKKLLAICLHLFLKSQCYWSQNHLRSFGGIPHVSPFCLIV